VLSFPERAAGSSQHTIIEGGRRITPGLFCVLTPHRHARGREAPTFEPMTQLLTLTVADEPSTWEALGFTVEDIAVRIGTVTILCAGASNSADEPKGIVEWTIGWNIETLEAYDLDPDDLPGDIDGVPTSAIVGAGTPPIAPVHPNGVTSIDHVVVMTPDLDRTVAEFEALGISCRRVREGAAYGSKTMRQAFFWLGNPDGTDAEKVIVEVVGPDVVDPEKSDEPASFFGLALTSSDLVLSASTIGEHMKPATDAVQPGRKIASISSKAGSTVALVLMSAHVG
jgi:hypothetical protein